jgi:hypothetical protein
MKNPGQNGQVEGEHGILLVFFYSFKLFGQMPNHYFSSLHSGLPVL